jgi:UDP-N-acetylglucosamine 4-epimerase
MSSLGSQFARSFGGISEQFLLGNSRHWLVTGAGGFIGSHLVDALLALNQNVTGLDNFATGHESNLASAQTTARDRGLKFVLMRGDIRDSEVCSQAARSTDFVLHQAALGSVPLSIENPALTTAVNVEGTINVFNAARKAGVQRVVFASSSSVYGDDPALQKIESQTGACLSPYAASKSSNELYATAFGSCYGSEIIGLRYFNVFGPRQDPKGPYAAVIPKWTEALLSNQPVYINGDGETTRDFCYITNVVQANLLAALRPFPTGTAPFFNVGAGGRTTLNQLFDIIRFGLAVRRPTIAQARPLYRDFRVGDIRHSQADIEKARQFLGFEPLYSLEEGLREALPWYEHRMSSAALPA